MKPVMQFWDAKRLYFRRLDNRDITEQQRANLRLLEAMLDQAYNSGYAAAKKEVDASVKVW